MNVHDNLHQILNYQNLQYVKGIDTTSSRVHSYLFVRVKRQKIAIKRNNAKSKISAGRKAGNGIVHGNPNSTGLTDATPKVLSSHVPSDGFVHGNPINTTDNGLQIEQSN